MSDQDLVMELDTEFQLLREACSEVVVPPAPPLEAIESRGRTHRRHRRLRRGASVAALAVVGTGLAFSGGGHGADGNGGRHATPVAVAPAIRSAAYTIVSNADGTTTLTIKLDEIRDPSALRDDLAKVGIPALVTPGKICTTTPAPADFNDVVSFDPGSGEHPGDPVRPATVTIDSAAMPAGTELSIGTIPLHTSTRYPNLTMSSIALIDTGHYSCSSLVPTDALPDGSGPGPTSPSSFDGLSN